MARRNLPSTEVLGRPAHGSSPLPRAHRRGFTSGDGDQRYEFGLDLLLRGIASTLDIQRDGYRSGKGDLQTSRPWALGPKEAARPVTRALSGDIGRCTL
jgi:hypothetical protein